MSCLYSAASSTLFRENSTLLKLFLLLRLCGPCQRNGMEKKQRKKKKKKDKQHRRLAVQDSLVLSRFLLALTSKNAIHLLCGKFQRVTLHLQIKLINPCQLTTKYSLLSSTAVLSAVMRKELKSAPPSQTAITPS